MTVETEVANLTTAVDNLASAVNVSKATLDTSVSSASSSADDALDSKIAAAVSAAAAELQRSAADAAAAYAATSSALAQTYHISGRNAVNGVMPAFLADFSGQVIDFPNRISSDEAINLRTQTNSAGVIQWAPHNLIKSSEDFASSDWTKTDTTVTSNAAMAPDGTLTADKISHTSTVAQVQQSVTVTSGADYVSVLAAKYIDHQWLAVFIDSGKKVWFDLLNGVVGTDTVGSCEMVLLGDGWYQLKMPSAAPDSSRNFSITLADGDNSNTETSGTSAYIWGAHIYRNDLGGMAKVPTSDRALAALEYYVPNKAVVIGPNLVSNGTFDTSVSEWNKGGAFAHTLTWNAGVAELTRDATAGNDQDFRQTFPTVVGKWYRLTGTHIGRVSGSGATRLVVLAGTGGTTLVTTAYNNTSSPVTDRVYFQATASTSILMLISGGGLVASVGSFDNITIEEVDRNPSAERHLPRRENHVYDGTAWVKGLLVEPDRATNYIRVSSDYEGNGAVAGTLDTTGVLPSYFGKANIPNSAVEVIGWGTEDGRDYIDIRINGTPTGSPLIQLEASTGIATSLGEDWAESCYVSMVAGSMTNLSPLQLRVAEIDGGGSTLSSVNIGDAFTPTATAVRQWGTHTTAQATVAYIRPMILLPWTSGAVDITLRISAPQMEKGLVPTSYIPTSGAAVTRQAETVTIPASVMDSLGLFNSVAVDGTELVTNGTFDSDLTGWSQTGSDFTWSAGKAVGVATGGTVTTLHQVVTTEVGKVYKFDFTISGTENLQGSDAFVTIREDGPNAGTENVSLDVIAMGNGNHSASFVATTTTSYVSFKFTSSCEAGDTFSVDNISVKEIHRRGIGIQMHGYMSYGDEGAFDTVVFYRYQESGSNFIKGKIDTDIGEGQLTVATLSRSISDVSDGASDQYSPSVMVPFKIAARHLDNALQGAADGTATTENTTLVGLPDLSGIDLEMAYIGPAIHITKFNIFAENTKSSDGTFKMEETFLQRASS